MRSPIVALLLLVASMPACSPSSSTAEREAADARLGMMSEQDGAGMMGGPAGDGMGMMDGGMMDDAGAMGDMATIRQLLTNHERIERTVENVPGGVRTVTVSGDPEVTALIREHVREMKARYGRGRPIRTMDPVFRELFRHRDRATLEIEDIAGGVRVLHTSEDPKVTALIRQHAHEFVSEAAEQGMRRAMRPTTLPEGYAPAN